MFTLRPLVGLAIHVRGVVHEPVPERGHTTTTFGFIRHLRGGLACFFRVFFAARVNAPNSFLAGIGDKRVGVVVFASHPAGIILALVLRLA